MGNTSKNNVQSELLVRLCKLYYIENKTQVQISKALGISRPQISRFLKEARRKGLVRIQISSDKIPEEKKLAKTLKEKYNLKNVIVTDENDSDHSSLAKAASSFISGYIKDQQVIGVSWGAVISKVVDNIVAEKALKNTTFVPMVGGMDQVYFELQANTLVDKISRVFKSRSVFLNAPAYYEDAALMNLMSKSGHVKNAIDYWSKIDIAFVTIGYFEALSKEYKLLFDSNAIRELHGRGAVGDIAGRFFNRDGVSCSPDNYNNRLLGVNLGQMKRIPDVVGIAGGVNKAEAIHGSIRGGYVKSLITDTAAAMELISYK